MSKTDRRFSDLKAFRAEKARLRMERTASRHRLGRHFSAWKQPAFRSAMAQDLGGQVTEWLLPKGLLGALVGKLDLGSGLRMALSPGRGGLVKRAVLFALGIAAPSLLEKLQHISWEDIGAEFQLSWQRWKEHQRNRRDHRMPA